MALEIAHVGGTAIGATIDDEDLAAIIVAETTPPPPDPGSANGATPADTAPATDAPGKQVPPAAHR